jgi:hypothetical protein
MVIEGFLDEYRPGTVLPQGKNGNVALNGVLRELRRRLSTFRPELSTNSPRGGLAN